MEKEIIYKYISGNASVEEKFEVMRWVAENEDNRLEFMAMRKLYDIEIWHPSLVGCKSVRPVVSWKSYVRKVLEMAAVFCMVWLYYHFPKFNNREMWQSAYAPAGQRAELVLADGSKVWLNACSRLSFPESFDDEVRKVKIEGEGYFQVAKNTGKPFVVETDGYEVRVTGTEFNVVAYPGSGFFETSLVEGSVDVTSKLSHDRVSLRPNMKVYADRNGMYVNESVSMNDFMWREGIVNFEDESVPDILKKIERYYDVRIYLKDSRFNRIHLSGKFRIKDGVDHILKTLQVKCRFEYQYNSELNTIAIQ